MSKKESKKSKEEQKKLEKVKEAVEEDKKQKETDVKAALATREALEKDYQDDTMMIDFESSSNKLYKIEVKKPTNKEQGKLIELSIAAMKSEDSNDPKDLKKIQEIQVDLAKMAGKLTVKDDLDVDFFNESIASQTLVNLVVSMVSQAQGVKDEEIRKFRE